MRDWQVKDLDITVDSVLRGQGADPDILRSRSPRLVKVAERALSQTRDLLEPRVLLESFNVSSLKHDRLRLNNQKVLSGPLVSGHLAGAEEILAVICTVGKAVDEYAEKVIEEDIVLGLAVEGVGAAAVEGLANAVCREIELEAESRGLRSTIPLSPGMIGWDVEAGQKMIFSLLQPSQIEVELTPHLLMIPRKSLSMLIGLGKNISADHRICDFCAMRKTCRYQLSQSHV